MEKLTSYTVRYDLDENQQATLEMLTDWANKIHEEAADGVHETPAEFFASIMTMGALGHVREAISYWQKVVEDDHKHD